MAKDKQPQFSIRNEPQQNRARRTVNAILQATAELIEQNGFEQVSTNQICKQANLTPPALYRYFPNKYAVMRELGERLFRAQLEMLIEWENERAEISVTQSDIETLLRSVLSLAYKHPAGPWIMRSLHASPYLLELRLTSLRELADFLTDRIMRFYPALDREEMLTRIRFAIESGYSTIELIFDDPELDAQRMVRIAAETLNETWLRGLSRGPASDPA